MSAIIVKKMSKNKIFFGVMFLLAIGVNIKYIFCDMGIDSTYQVTMAYRLATGDLMFKHMWEAHQTSAFLCAFLIKIYLFLFKTTTGIVIYLQVLGVLIDGVISYLIYKVANAYSDSKNEAWVMAWLFFIISPKDVPIAEFANMQIWFSMLLGLMLYLFDKTRKKKYLVLTALNLCMVVLSYPSCVILVIGVALLLFWRKQIKAFFIVIAVCIISATLYLGYILSYMSISELGFALKNMLSIEPTHTVGLSNKFRLYAFDFLKIAIILCITYIVSSLFVYGICKFRKKELVFKKEITNILFCALTMGISLYTVIGWKTYERCFYSVSFVAIIITGFQYRKKIPENIRYLYICGTLISIMNFLATILLTDLNLLTSIPYLLIAVVVAVLPIAEMLKEFNGNVKMIYFIKGIIVFGTFCLVFRSIYIIRPIYSWISPITEVSSIVKEGPAIGMISEYMGPYMQNESMKEWKEYVKEGSAIYLIGGGIDTLGYLYADTVIAAPSVMSTPGYNKSISNYWEINPEKYPDVVIASCWYGEMEPALLENEWIMQWLNEEFKAQYYIDGKYWRYYYRDMK